MYILYTIPDRKPQTWKFLCRRRGALGEETICLSLQTKMNPLFEAIQLWQVSSFNHTLSLHYFLLFLCATILIWFIRVRSPKIGLNLPPSPPRLPILGHLHLLGALPHHSLRLLSDKYGPLMLLHFGHAPTLLVSSPEMAKLVMKTNDAVFSDRPIITAAKAFVYGGKDITFAPNGDYWREMRKISVMDLLSAKRVQSFKFIRDEEGVNMVKKIKQACSTKTAVNVSDLIMVIIINTISRSTLGRSLEGEWRSKYAELTKQVMDYFGQYSIGDLFPSLGWVDAMTGLRRNMNKTCKKLSEFLDQVIDEHVACNKDNAAHADRKDFVDILLEYERNPMPGISFTRKNIRAILTDIFVAGTDTIYTTVEWAMAELMNHPNIMIKLQEEIRQVVGVKDQVDEEDIRKMSYLNCVIKETLRMHPPLVLSVPKISVKSTTIEGYYIPAKTRLMINTWAIARDTNTWDDPDEFKPERFADTSVDFRGNDYEFTPFGAGRRGCPGISFAVASVESVLASLLYCFDWEMPEDATNKDIDMTENFGLSVNMKCPLHLVPVSHFS